jgi:hypothetical protein
MLQRATAWDAGRCRINGEYPTGKALTIQPLDCRFQVSSVGKFNKAEPSRMASYTVTYYLCERDGMAVLLEPVL